MKYKINYNFPYDIKHNCFTRIHTFFLHFDGKSGVLKILVYLFFLLFRWLAFFALKIGLKFSTKGYIDKKEFNVRPTNSQFCSIYFKHPEKFYEIDVYTVIEAFLPDNGVFIDVGANWGHHTFHAAVKKNSNVYAFEPHPQVYTDLKRVNDDLNLNHKVTSYNLALGHEENELQLVQNYFESGTSSLEKSFSSKKLVSDRINYFLHRLTFNNPISWKVEVVKLDDVLSDLPSVDLIKLDAEGAEMNVLKGATSILEKCKPKIIMELNTADKSEFNEILGFFENLNYNLFMVRGDIVKQAFEIKLLDSQLPSGHYNILAVNNEDELAMNYKLY